MILMNKIQSFLKSYWQIFPWLGYGFLLTVVIGGLHSLNLSQPLIWLLDTLLFVAGYWLSTLLFSFETKINALVDTVGAWLAHEEPLQPEQPLPIQTQSWLRSNTILLMLPLLTIYLLTSSQSALGFGFLFGISLIYGIDIWKFTRNLFPSFLQIYFFQKPSTSYLQALIFGYAAYFSIFSLALILL